MNLWGESQQFFGFYLIERVLEENLNKCEVVICMVTPTINKEVMKLNGSLIAQDKFISMSAHHAFPFYELLNK